MASLNHVSMWSKHGWVHVTAEQASMLHPGGTVSAHSGLFMCELCGQYVILTDGAVRDRYFKHSASEANKNCPERTFGASYVPTYNASEHELPIKLIVDASKFRFEIGLIYVPSSIIKAQEVQAITVKLDSGKQFVFSFERLNSNSITYFPLGSEPSKYYTIETTDELSTFWPRKVRGVANTGSVFDGKTGKLLPLDADVQVCNKYYLLTTNSFIRYRLCKGISIAKKSEQRVGWVTWYLYEVEANELCEDAAKFFLNYHCRLTDTPMELIPVWPIHIQTPYVLKHDSKNIIMHISGARKVTPKSFPNATIYTHGCPDGSQVISAFCNDRQQLISAGSANVLQYLYLWRSPLTATADLAAVDVRDKQGAIINDGEQSELPERETVIIFSPFDGVVLVKKEKKVIEKIAMPAGKKIVLNQIRFGQTIQIAVGLDVVWEVVYKKPVLTSHSNDSLLYQKLCSLKGASTSIPHSFGAIIEKLYDYPKTRSWVSKAIRQGYAPENAIKYLRRYLSDNAIHQKGD